MLSFFNTKNFFQSLFKAYMAKQKHHHFLMLNSKIYLVFKTDLIFSSLICFYYVFVNWKIYWNWKPSQAELTKFETTKNRAYLYRKLVYFLEIKIIL